MTNIKLLLATTDPHKALKEIGSLKVNSWSHQLKEQYSQGIDLMKNRKRHATMKCFQTRTRQETQASETSKRTIIQIMSASRSNKFFAETFSILKGPLLLRIEMKKT